MHMIGDRGGGPVGCVVEIGRTGANSLEGACRLPRSAGRSLFISVWLVIMRMIQKTIRVAGSLSRPSITEI